MRWMWHWAVAGNERAVANARGSSRCSPIPRWRPCLANLTA